MLTTWLEQIAVTLFLILGLNAFQVTHAADDHKVPMSEEVTQNPVQGYVPLRLYESVEEGKMIRWVYC